MAPPPEARTAPPAPAARNAAARAEAGADAPLLAQVVELARERIAPQALEHDRDGRFPKAHIEALAAMGLMGLEVPKAYGGLGLGLGSMVRVMEALAAADASTSITWGVHVSVATQPILAWGSEAQKKAWLPALASGERLGAFALSEAASASDAAGSMAATAQRKGDEYVLNGQKVWITNATHAGLYIVFVKTAPELRAKGISAFVVPREAPGVSVGKHEDKLGLRASDTSTLHLDDAVVPVANRLGQEGDGFRVAMSVLDASRVGVGAQGLGMARAAVDHAAAWAREHGAGQGAQFRLADLATRVQAGRLLVHRAAALRDAGKPFTREASMAKLYGSELAMEAASFGVTLRGEAGASPSDAERIFRDAKVSTIYEGTSEVQRIVIARQLGLAG